MSTPQYKRPNLIQKIAGAKDITERLRPIIGVYIICDQMTVLYVGQSVDVLSRVKHHKSIYHRSRSTVYVVRCPEYQLNELEGALIRALEPIHNGRTKDGYYATNTPRHNHRDTEIIAQLTGEPRDA